LPDAFIDYKCVTKS
jgi:hypothetical protein